MDDVYNALAEILEYMGPAALDEFLNIGGRVYFCNLDQPRGLYVRDVLREFLKYWDGIPAEFINETLRPLANFLYVYCAAYSAGAAANKVIQTGAPAPMATEAATQEAQEAAGATSAADRRLISSMVEFITERINARDGITQEAAGKP